MKMQLNETQKISCVRKENINEIIHSEPPPFDATEVDVAN